MAQKQYGVLLVNLGTPDAPTSAAVKRYLSEFLHDKRVVDLSRWLWCPLLHGVILPIRAPRVAKLYQSVWRDDGSPLLAFSRQQQQALYSQLQQQGHDIPVELAMTYGNPSLSHALDQLQSKGVTNLVVLPLFPQYSSSTTAAVWDGLTKALKSRRNIPAIRFIRDYYDHPLYIAALAESIRQHLPELPDKLIFSYHGIPQRYVDEGDQYAAQCQTTTERVAQALGLSETQYLHTYQSRFGREVWLQPYTDHTLKALPKQGIKTLGVVCPAFSADCLETLEEITEQNREIFLHAGGQAFTYVPALNADPSHIVLLESLVCNEIENW
ncbi:ferrochelatase [Plesiomonas sp.]|uniref:ferrochelatase n=1 Tax=Plesiomonas sp. TaxID=2486279 RepID=UPI003F2FC907